MARPKFEIKTKRDSASIREYFKNNLEKILMNLETTKEKEALEKSVLNLNDEYYIKYIGTENEKIELYKKQTHLLYTLPHNVIEKIKISLRSKRKLAYEKKKVQLTIDRSAHINLSMYAKQYNITLSEAIEKLLIK